MSAEQVTGQPVLQIKLNQEQLARLRRAGQGRDRHHRIDRQQAAGRSDRRPIAVSAGGAAARGVCATAPTAIGSILIPTASGERLPLSRLADIRIVEGPVDDHARMGPAADHRLGQRPRPRHRQLRGRGPAAAASDKLTLPPGRYFYEFGGQFEHLQRARTRLLIVVPLAAVLIFALLYLTYQNVVDALRVFTGVPFGWVGGIFALWLRDMPFSISAAIGFIALSGVAVLDDMILVSLRPATAPARACRSTRPSTQAAITRLRPVLMTTLVASLGFLPMAFSTGMGAEVQRPLATVVIGGVIGAMVMSLLGAARAVRAVQVAGEAATGRSRSSKMTPQLVEVGSY